MENRKSSDEQLDNLESAIHKLSDPNSSLIESFDEFSNALKEIETSKSENIFGRIVEKIATFYFYIADKIEDIFLK